MVGVEAMQVAEAMLDVEPMRELAEELVARLVVQSVASPVAKLVVAVMTGIRRWALSEVEATMHLRLTGMLGEAQANTVSKKPASPGLAIGVASSSYPLPSACRSC